QDRRSLEYGASDGDTLLFAAGKLQTAFANLGIIAFRCAANESIDLSLARRFLDFGVARIPAPVADVVADRVVKQNPGLRHHADRSAQGGLGNLADVLVVNHDATTGNIVKTKQQPRNCRFAGPRGSDNCDRAPRGDVKAQIGENRPRWLIGKGYVFEPD